MPSPRRQGNTRARSGRCLGQKGGGTRRRRRRCPHRCLARLVLPDRRQQLGVDVGPGLGGDGEEEGGRAQTTVAGQGTAANKYPNARAVRERRTPAQDSGHLQQQLDQLDPAVPRGHVERRRAAELVPGLPLRRQTPGGLAQGAARARQAMRPRVWPRVGAREACPREACPRRRPAPDQNPCTLLLARCRWSRSLGCRGLYSARRQAADKLGGAAARRGAHRGLHLLAVQAVLVAGREHRLPAFCDDLRTPAPAGSGVMGQTGLCTALAVRVCTGCLALLLSEPFHFRDLSLPLHWPLSLPCSCQPVTHREQQPRDLRGGCVVQRLLPIVRRELDR